MNLKERAKKLKTDIPTIYLAINDKDTPISAKIFAGITVAYALSPIDLIPDFIPVLGYLDDLVILPALAALTLRCIPKETFERCCGEAAGMWADGKPKRWYYALPILVLWVLAAIFLVKLVLHLL